MQICSQLTEHSTGVEAQTSEAVSKNGAIAHRYNAGLLLKASLVAVFSSC